MKINEKIKILLYTYQSLQSRAAVNNHALPRRGHHGDKN